MKFTLGIVFASIQKKGNILPWAPTKLRLDCACAALSELPRSFVDVKTKGVLVVVTMAALISVKTINVTIYALWILQRFYILYVHPFHIGCLLYTGPWTMSNQIFNVFINIYRYANKIICILWYANWINCILWQRDWRHMSKLYFGTRFSSLGWVTDEIWVLL